VAEATQTKKVTAEEAEGSRANQEKSSKGSTDGGVSIAIGILFLLLRTLCLCAPQDAWMILLPAFLFSAIGWIRSKNWKMTGLGMGLTGVTGGEFFGSFLYFLREQGVW
jgi:hypothetical protein